MCDVKVGVEAFQYALQDFFALVHMHVRDADVAGKGLEAGANRPNVDVVDFLNALDAQDRTRHGFQTNAFRQPLQQNVPGFAEKAIRGPEYEGGDGHADGRIKPLCTRRSNGNGPCKDAEIRNRIAEIMKEQTSEVKIAPAADQCESDCTVNGQRQNASQNRTSATRISKIALVNAARTPARW
jgi:hypothetical protein